MVTVRCGPVKYVVGYGVHLPVVSLQEGHPFSITLCNLLQKIRGERSTPGVDYGPLLVDCAPLPAWITVHYLWIALHFRMCKILHLPILQLTDAADIFPSYYTELTLLPAGICGCAGQHRHVAWNSKIDAAPEIA
jgi:hypothetical protein